MNRLRPPLPPQGVLDFERLRQRMAVFQRLRPWFPRDSQCLFDSLLAADYLTAYGWYPRLVFGVQSEPFYAHCWLQEADVVVNDTLERAAAFAPILVV